MSVTLERVDSVPDSDVLSDDLKLWLSNLVDIINYDLTKIEGELMSLDARITALGG